MPDPKIEEFMNEEIERAPQAPNEQRQRLAVHNSTSPADSGGDIDADWADANSTGSEAFGGHNPTPDQSDTEANAAAMGFTYEDNQEVDLLDKMQKRDRNRFELDEDSKDGDTI